MRTLRFAAVLLATVLFSLTFVGCGPPKEKAKTANVTAGTMPDGAEWTGVYYSPLYGYLHMVQEGSLVNGKWQRPLKGRWGELQGNVDGNLMRFDWTEYVDGLVGPNSKKSGKGYFMYSRPEGENVDDRIAGEIGRGDNEVGDPWDAIKQRNVKAELDSIGGAGSREVGGGDWDGGNTESSDPEEPVEPEVEAPEL